MDTTKRSTRTLVRAVGSALAVGIVGIGALPAATAEAAGVRAGGPTRTPAPPTVPVADPAGLPGPSSTVVRYRVEGGTLRALRR
jgi:hypothetical protein